MNDFSQRTSRFMSDFLNVFNVCKFFNFIQQCVFNKAIDF